MNHRRIYLSLLFSLLVPAFAAEEARAQFFRESVAPPPFHVLQFGMAVAASSDTLVVGAPDSVRNNDTSNCSTAYVGFGSVIVYKKNQGSWAVNQQLWHDPYTNTTNWEPRYGSAVALKDNTLIVGAERLQYQSTMGAGAFYLFKRTSASAPFSRFGPFYAPTPVGSARLGEHGGVATNGTYIAINGVGFVLYYRIQGTSVSFVQSVALPVMAPVERMLITNDNVLVTLISGYTTLPAYQLGPAGYTTLNTSALNDGSLYTRPAAVDGNSIVTGLNGDPRYFRVVDFSGGAVSSVVTRFVEMPASLQSPTATAVAIKEGAGFYVGIDGSNGSGSYLAEFLSPSYILTSVTSPLPSTYSHYGGTSAKPAAFNGDEVFFGSIEGSGGDCNSNFPSRGTVHSVLAGGVAKALLSSILFVR